MVKMTEAQERFFTNLSKVFGWPESHLNYFHRTAQGDFIYSNNIFVFTDAEKRNEGFLSGLSYCINARLQGENVPANIFVITNNSMLYHCYSWRFADYINYPTIHPLDWTNKCLPYTGNEMVIHAYTLADAVTTMREKTRYFRVTIGSDCIGAWERRYLNGDDKRTEEGFYNELAKPKELAPFIEPVKDVYSIYPLSSMRKKKKRYTIVVHPHKGYLIASVISSGDPIFDWVNSPDGYWAKLYSGYDFETLERIAMEFNFKFIEATLTDREQIKGYFDNINDVIDATGGNDSSWAKYNNTLEEKRREKILPDKDKVNALCEYKSKLPRNVFATEYHWGTPLKEFTAPALSGQNTTPSGWDDELLKQK